MPDRVPAHVPVLGRNIRDVTQLVQDVPERTRAVGVPLSRQPERVRIVVGIVLLSFCEPLLERSRCPFSETHGPILRVLRGLVFRDSEDAVIDVHPVDGRAFDFDGT